MVEKTEKQDWNTNHQLLGNAQIHQDAEARVQGWAGKPRTTQERNFSGQLRSNVKISPVPPQRDFIRKTLLSYKQAVPSIWTSPRARVKCNRPLLDHPWQCKHTWNLQMGSVSCFPDLLAKPKGQERFIGKHDSPPSFKTRGGQCRPITLGVSGVGAAIPSITVGLAVRSGGGWPLHHTNTDLTHISCKRNGFVNTMCAAVLLQPIVSTTSETVHKKEDASKAKWGCVKNGRMLCKQRRGCINPRHLDPSFHRDSLHSRWVWCLRRSSSKSKCPKTKLRVSHPLPPVRSLPFAVSWIFGVMWAQKGSQACN